MTSQNRKIAPRRAPKKDNHTKPYMLCFLTALVTTLIIGRLFYLQIIKNSYYQSQVNKDHTASTELPARRGEIFVKDYHSGEKIRIATNTTLDLLFADPTLIPNKQLVAETIAPIIYNEELEREKNLESIKELNKSLKEEPTTEQIKALTPLNSEELYRQFFDNLLTKVSQDQRPQILLTTKLEQSAIDSLQQQIPPGVEIKGEKVFAYPAQINNRKSTAIILSPYLDIPEAQLERILQGKNRYTILQRKLTPEQSAKIVELKKEKPEEFLGINLKEEYFRYYPEQSLAANILGFVDHKGQGQYGIESKFNTELEGKKGLFHTQVDSIGRHITIGDSIIRPAVNGDSVTLTIDRSIQMEVEKRLSRQVRDFNADSGSVIVMEPQTGKIIAMAHYPTFDPNNYNKVFDKEIINLSPEQVDSLVPQSDEPDNKRYWFYRNRETFDRFEIFASTDDEGNTTYRRYKNFYGPMAYQNLAVSGIYEPGSVMKSIAMAIGIDNQSITASTTYREDGPIEVDEFSIRNALDKYRGLQTMTDALGQSSNIGMAVVARKVGRILLYNYYKKFGFSERTDIEFSNEQSGTLEHYNQWAESELITRSFGQGVAVTPIQMITAYGALSNKGRLMKPYIVESVQSPNGKEITTDPKIIDQIIQEKTAETITDMLVNGIENGVAQNAKLPGHYVAGKTGTSQTYRNGKPLEGPGTTITSFAGYAPIDNPKFIVLVKIDRPRKDIWGSTVAAPLFKDIATYLLQYYSIPEDKT